MFKEVGGGGDETGSDRTHQRTYAGAPEPDYIGRIAIETVVYRKSADPKVLILNMIKYIIVLKSGVEAT